MKEDYGSQFVRFDEAVFERVHPSLWQYRKKFAISLTLLLASFFLLYPLFRLGGMRMLLFVALVGSSAAVFAAALFMRSRTVAIVTNQRIIDIDRTGLFEKRVAEVELGHIEDIRYTAKGVLASVFGYGTVTVQAKRGRIELANVPDPAHIQQTLQQIQKQHTKTQNRGQDETTNAEEE